jgi:hypothetical protein
MPRILQLRPLVEEIHFRGKNMEVFMGELWERHVKIEFFFVWRFICLMEEDGNIEVTGRL